MNKNVKITAFFTICALAFGMSGCDFNFSVGNTATMPSEAELQSLIKTTTSDFADAVEKGDFTTFHTTISSDLQKQVSADKFKAAFATFIEKKQVIAPLLKQASKTDANFSPAPVLRTENGTPVVDVAGAFPTDPAVNFKCSYEHEKSGNWKLLVVNYNM